MGVLTILELRAVLKYLFAVVILRIFSNQGFFKSQVVSGGAVKRNDRKMEGTELTKRQEHGVESLISKYFGFRKFSELYIYNLLTDFRILKHFLLAFLLFMCTLTLGLKEDYSKYM